MTKIQNILAFLSVGTNIVLTYRKRIYKKNKIWDLMIL